MICAYPIIPGAPDGPTILLANDDGPGVGLADCAGCVISTLHAEKVSALRLHVAGENRTCRVRHSGPRGLRRRAAALETFLAEADPHPRWPTFAAFEADPPPGHDEPLWRPGADPGLGNPSTPHKH